MNDEIRDFALYVNFLASMTLFIFAGIAFVEFRVWRYLFVSLAALVWPFLVKLAANYVEKKIGGDS